MDFPGIPEIPKWAMEPKVQKSLVGWLTVWPKTGLPEPVVSSGFIGFSDMTDSRVGSSDARYGC